MIKKFVAVLGGKEDTAAKFSLLKKKSVAYLYQESTKIEWENKGKKMGDEGWGMGWGRGNREEGGRILKCPWCKNQKCFLRHAA